MNFKITDRIFCLILFLLNGNVFSQSLSLEEAFRKAIENNPEIKSAKLKVEKEEAGKSKSFNLPRPFLFMEYEGVKGSLNDAASRKIGIMQELEFPSNYFLRTDIQSTQVEIAVQELSKNINDLKKNIANNYLKLQRNHKLIEISLQNLKIYENFQKVAEHKYDAGSASNLEILAAKVNRIKFENEIKNLETETVVVKSELCRLMNVMQYDFEPADELNFDGRNFSKDSLMKSAYTNNPVLKIIRMQKEKTSDKISLTKSELLPNLSFKYYKQKIGNDPGYWGMEFGIGLPLWFWWEPAGNIKEANYEFKIASSQETEAKIFIENEVNRLYLEYQNGKRQGMFFQDEAIPEAEEIFRQAKVSYEEGAIGHIEYLQALQTVIETKTQYIETVFNIGKSIINLENITGSSLR